MVQLRKVLKFQLIILPSLVVLSCLLCIFIYHNQRSKFKELPLNDFIEKVNTNHIETIWLFDKRYEITIEKTGEKYYHLFSFNDKIELEKKTLGNFSPIFRIKESFNKTILLFAITFLSLMLILNIVIVWFITMFDLLKSEFINNNNKWIWFLCLILTPIVGPFYYLYIAEKQKITPDKS